ncbi:hypothetical protein B0J13DRAFT_529649 [Dactylonectria estremocensis]|uniref:Uncharacterized protein n=1 Tax=Dactylonectria estremocensis TaxID=1079267 RepID=A0A9P9IQR6_9HYPO|nr:hypothetical protein B0J13DRAFT_529649 [Dactylonectria estremocensis]
MIQSLFTDKVIEIRWSSCALGGSVAIGEICAGTALRLFGKALKAHWQMRTGAAGMCDFVADHASVGLGDDSKAIALTTMAGFSVGYVELLALVMVPFTVAPGDVRHALD